jgi:hypothetical protein
MTLRFDNPRSEPPAPIAPASAERRAHARHTVDFPAILRSADGDDIRGRVRDVSAMGALIELPAGIVAPATFRLIIAAEMFSADCEVRHRTNGHVGVVFTSGRLEAMARFG